jgi:hypothetical protein
MTFNFQDESRGDSSEDGVKNTETRLEFNLQLNFNLRYNNICYINVQF